MGETILYLRHERLIHDICWRFQRRFGGDHEELLSDAHLGFLKAARTWRPERSRFSTWVTRLVWQALAHERGKRKPFPDLLPEEAWGAVESKTNGFLSELTGDARIAVKAIADARSLAGLGDLGWAGARVVEALREVKEVLA